MRLPGKALAFLVLWFAVNFSFVQTMVAAPDENRSDQSEAPTFIEDDMAAIMAPYIGKWSSPAKIDNEPYAQWVVSFEWFDRRQHIAKVVIELFSGGSVSPNFEAFYSVHPLDGQINVHGYHVAGFAPQGRMVAYDPSTGAWTIENIVRLPNGSLLVRRDNFSGVENAAWTLTSYAKTENGWAKVQEFLYEAME